MIDFIKEVDAKIAQLFKEKKLKGTIHLSDGQEAIDVGVISAFEYETRVKPFVIGNHRSHGQYLMCGGTEEKLIEEISIFKGQHLHIKDRFITTGIQGGLTAFGVGYAMTLKDPHRVLCFIGDGTFGEGILYEAFGLASLFRPNITFIVIDNEYSMSRTLMNPKISKIAEAYDLAYLYIEDGWDFNSVFNKSSFFFNVEKGPQIIHARCKRLCGHSCNDTQVYRPKEELTIEYKNKYASRFK